MRSKLSANADYFTNEHLRMSYVQNQVDGMAAKHLAPRLRARALNEFNNADEMLEVLQRVFADLNRCQTALIAFRKQHQGKQDFNPF